MTVSFVLPSLMDLPLLLIQVQIAEGAAAI